MQGSGAANHTRSALDNILALLCPFWLLPINKTWGSRQWNLAELKLLRHLDQSGRVKQWFSRTTLLSHLLALWGGGTALWMAKSIPLGRSSKKAVSSKSAMGSFAKSDLEKSPYATPSALLDTWGTFVEQESCSKLDGLGKTIQFMCNIVIT